MRLRNLLMIVLLLCATSQVFAESASTYLGISVNVVPICQIAVTDLGFGTYDPLVANAGQPLDATAEVQMLCTKSAQANVILDYGRNSQGAARGMAAGLDRVNYGLFQDPARTKIWSDGENSLHVIGAGGRTPQRYVVYGRVAAGQEVPPGAYSDVVMATVDF